MAKIGSLSGINDDGMLQLIGGHNTPVQDLLEGKYKCPKNSLRFKCFHRDREQRCTYFSRLPRLYEQWKNILPINLCYRMAAYNDLMRLNSDYIPSIIEASQHYFRTREEYWAHLQWESEKLFIDNKELKYPCEVSGPLCENCLTNANLFKHISHFHGGSSTPTCPKCGKEHPEIIYTWRGRQLKRAYGTGSQRYYTTIPNSRSAASYKIEPKKLDLPLEKYDLITELTGGLHPDDILSGDLDITGIEVNHSLIYPVDGSYINKGLWKPSTANGEVRFQTGEGVVFGNIKPMQPRSDGIIETEEDILSYSIDYQKGTVDVTSQEGIITGIVFSGTLVDPRLRPHKVQALIEFSEGKDPDEIIERMAEKEKDLEKITWYMRWGIFWRKFFSRRKKRHIPGSTAFEAVYETPKIEQPKNNGHDDYDWFYFPVGDIILELCLGLKVGAQVPPKPEPSVLVSESGVRRSSTHVHINGNYGPRTVLDHLPGPPIITNNRGFWDASVSDYRRGDLVFFSGQSYLYVSNMPCLQEKPDTSGKRAYPWSPLLS